MFAIKPCPYCKADNQIETSDWERVKCPNCEGVFYAEITQDISVVGFSDKGKDTEHTIEG